MKIPCVFVFLFKIQIQYQNRHQIQIQNRPVFGAGFGARDLLTKSGTKSFKVFDPPKLPMHRSSEWSEPMETDNVTGERGS